MKVNKMVREYKMNSNAKIKIESKRDGDLYRNKVTLTYETTTQEPMLKKPNLSRSELADKIADIDLSDENGTLFGPNDD